MQKNRSCVKKPIEAIALVEDGSGQCASFALQM